MTSDEEMVYELFRLRAEVKTLIRERDEALKEAETCLNGLDRLAALLDIDGENRGAKMEAELSRLGAEVATLTATSEAFDHIVRLSPLGWGIEALRPQGAVAMAQALAHNMAAESRAFVRLTEEVAALTAQVERVRAWTETAETDVSGPDVPRAFDEGKAEGYRECRDHVVALLAAPDAPGER